MCVPPRRSSHCCFGKVARTGKGGFIPVYRDVKNGRTRTITIVKKATGDMKVSGSFSDNVFCSLSRTFFLPPLLLLVLLPLLSFRFYIMPIPCQAVLFDFFHT